MANKTPVGGIGSNQHETKPATHKHSTVSAARAKQLDDNEPAQQPAMTLPPALADYRCSFGGPLNPDEGYRDASLQDRINELGWTDVRFIRVRGEQQYDDEGFYTPEWTLAVNGDIPTDKIGWAIRQAALAEAAENGVDDPDEIEAFLEDVADTNAFNFISAANMAKAGIIECWLPHTADPFDDFYVDDIDFEDDEPPTED